MARFRRYWSNVRDVLRYYLGGIYRNLEEKEIFLWAQAVAFKVLITIVPVLVLVTGILGLLLKGDDAFVVVARFIRGFLPPSESAQIIDFLDRLQSASTTFLSIGIVGLIFSAMTLFTTLRIVVSNVFQEEWHKQRSIIRGYLFDLRMAGQVGLLFVLTVALTLLVPKIEQGGIDVAMQIGLDFPLLRQGWRSLFSFALLLVPYLLSLAMFFQLFFFVPKPRPPKRSALLGAIVTGLLWELAKNAFTIYAATIGRFDRYVTGPAGEESFRALGEVFGLIIAFVFWVYYSGVVFIIGAVIAVLHEKRHRLKRLSEQRAKVRNKFGKAPTDSPTYAEPSQALGSGVSAGADDDPAADAPADAPADDAAPARPDVSLN